MNEDRTLAHRQIWELIPWVVNGTASPADRQRVDEHLPACVDCRDEFALQSRLHAGMTIESPVIPDAHPALARLLSRIDDASDIDVDSEDDRYEVISPVRRDHARSPRQTGLSVRWVQALVAAVIVQAVGLAVLGFGSMQRSPTAGVIESPARYETLTQAATPTSTATIRFVPAPTLTIGALQAILADAGLRIVESSEDSAIYGLAPKQDSANATTLAIARLRTHADVLLAEPIAVPAVDSQ